MRSLLEYGSKAMARLRSDFPQRTATPSPAPAPTCFSCGLQDSREVGWWNEETGELYHGFPITPADTVLDVGAGGGGASLFAARCGAEVLFADILPEVIERLTQQMRDSNARAYRGLLTDAQPLPLEEGAVSRVIAMEVIEHVEQPAPFLAELVRVGKPGALYLITVPDPTAEGLQKELAPQSYWRKPNHLHVFQHDDFDRLITDSGLIIERKFHYSFFWAMWWTFFWAADQDLGDPEGPVLAHWTRTWDALMALPKGDKVRNALDQLMPKHQGVIARKAA